MAHEFAGCDRDQLLLMPPALQEWLPEDHLAWTVLGVVDQMNLDRFALSKARARSAGSAGILAASRGSCLGDRLALPWGGGSYRFLVPLVGWCSCEPAEVMALYNQGHACAGLSTEHLQDGLAGCAVDLDASRGL
jgi:hypothetical protein